MNERITKLRENSLKAQATISHERARLLTEFYKSEGVASMSIPVQRAMGFKYLLENKEIWIGKDELIVGERGPSPKATPTYPEICLHSIEDLHTLHNRIKVSFKSDTDTREIYEEEIIPYWTGKTQREKVFANMDQEWIDAYNAGIFTEFQEQRAPGHTVLGNKIYHTGFTGINEIIKEKIDSVDFYNDPGAFDKKEELKAMGIAANALIKLAGRYSEKLYRMAADEKNMERKAELSELAGICHNVPANPPSGFHEALQFYWFVHLGVITELNPWDSFNPGRLDQHLYPFYRQDIERGVLTREYAKELLMAFWIKFNNHPAPPKIGITAKESNTYTDFALINIGGLKPDGSDAVNEMSYLILEVIEEMRILQPSSMVQVSKKNPDDLLRKALGIIKTGFGQPSVFNTDAIVQELVRQGKSLEDARNGGASGCVESGAFGTEAYFLTGYFNLPKVLEITLHNGNDPVSGVRLSPETGDPALFKDFDDLLDAFTRQLRHFIDIKIKGNIIIERLYANNMPVPFMSILIDDCIQKARDYNAGGARYNVSYVQGVGLGSVTDMLTAIKYHVYDNMSIEMEDLITALKANFEGYEEFRKALIYDTPKYGNDENYADNQAVSVFTIFYDAVNDRPNGRGGTFRINLLPTTSHVYFGSVMGASADGRKAGEPLSEGISPVQGADRKGPTAVLKSASKIDHIKTGGTLLNQKFNPDIFESDSGAENLLKLIRSYFRLDGHHIQFNIVSADMLRDAREHPEKYQDLIVRVAGYSDYFNDLTPELQEEIIRRTEHNA